MSTFKSHNEEAEIKPEIIEITQDEDQTQQQVQKIIQNQINPLEIQSEPEASTSEPQENESESLLVQKPGKRKMRKEVLPIETDRLIQLVRCMRCLYDPQHPRHRDTQVRRDLWDIIGKAMDLPGNECEKRWFTLKRNFKNIIKNKKKGNYKLAKSLIWYEEYIQITIDREVKKNLVNASTSKCSCRLMTHDIDVFLSGLLPNLKSLTPAEQDLAITQIFEVVTKYEKSSPHTLKMEVDMGWTENSNACEENWQLLIDKFTKSKNKNRDFKKLKWFVSYISTDEAALEDSVTYSQKKNSNSSGKMTFLHAIECQCNTAPLAHPMQKFLAEIATTLKKLPPQQQNLAKLEIFEIVHKFGLMKSTELPVTVMKTEIDSED